jgi:hypothetical protein
LSGTTEFAMRQEATVESAPEMLKQLPNLPPDTIVALPFNVPFIAEPPEPLLITVEPLTLSKDKCNTGVLSTSWPWTLAHSDANNAPRARSFVFMMATYTIVEQFDHWAEQKTMGFL